MKNKLATILCLGFLFFSKNISHAATGELWFGVNTKTTFILHNKEAVADYFLFGGANNPINDGDLNLLTENAKNSFVFSWVPIAVGASVGYSYYFTKKIGISFQGGLNQGNIAVWNISKEEYKKNNANVSAGSLQDTEKMKYKISIVSACVDLRFKYDLLNSSLDFDDYGRNCWKMDVSFGGKFDCFFSRKALILDRDMLGGDKDSENMTGNEKGVFSGDRINYLHPGIVLGLGATAPFNVGMALDVSYFFRNIFCADEDVKKKDSAWINNQTSQNIIKRPKYNTSCSFFQIDLRVFYDFAAFVNNHEAPSEIDIEKW